jgi:hypothetical protein
MELELFRVLDWKLNPVTPQAFIPLLLHGLKPMEQQEMHQYADVFLDLAICGYSLLQYLPSTIATSAILCAYSYVGSSAKHWLQSISELVPSSKIYSPQVQECTSELLRIFAAQFPDLASINDGGIISQGINSGGERCISPVSIMDMTFGVSSTVEAASRIEKGDGTSVSFTSNSYTSLEAKGTISIDLL